MAKTSNAGAEKFDSSRAAEYEQQSKIALAGYDACHELSACMLSASLADQNSPHVLVVGAGGPAHEITKLGLFQPTWRFTAIDPSEPMLSIAKSNIDAAGILDRVTLHPGLVEDLKRAPLYDAATLIGVLHHIPGSDEKNQILSDIAARLVPGAPLILACNHYLYAESPLLLKAWSQRWAMQGLHPDEVRSKLGTILKGADPPESEQAVFDLLHSAGFERPQRFFSSLFWGAWIVFRAR
ncbi:class I SAM-dependent methyltransferase [Advenella kashmirensis]